MPATDISFRIGGEAGQGVESSGNGYCQAFTFAGLHVFGSPDYYSRIRGGHNFYTIRVSDEPVEALRDQVEILLALNAETVGRHIDAMAPGGVIVIDDDIELDAQLLQGHEVKVLRPPLREIAEKHGSVVMTNTAALAVASALVDFGLDAMFAVIYRNFHGKGEKVVQANRAVAQEAYDWTRAQADIDLPWKVRPLAGQPQRAAMEGNLAFAMGAITAGCKFIASYPMTPATSVLEYLSLKADDWGLVARQAEGEIAAINMAVGASFAGVRSMVSTSGGGYDLMTEGVSLAGMTETPIVVYLGQRPGPATGMATRTAQTELRLALGSSHGEFPRMVMAPHSPVEFFNAAIRAFNIAETYQCVVIVLSDQYAATFMWDQDADAFDFEHVTIHRGKLVSPQELEGMSEYLRFRFTEDGVSPRALPGSHPRAVYPTTSDEHQENGHITEDATIAAAMQDKRLRKYQGLRREVRPPLRFGPEQAETTFVTWGSCYGPVHEAMERLNAAGHSANMLQFVDLWPFPAEATRAALEGAREIIDVEQNATAQFAGLLYGETGIAVNRRILKYDGRPFTVDYLLRAMEAK